MTYEEWFPVYLDTYKRKLKPRTREGYQSNHERYVLPVLGGKLLEDITPDDIQAVVNQAADHGGRQSVAVYQLLHAVFRRAVRSRHLSVSPVDAVDKPDYCSQPGQALTRADYEAVLPFVSDDLACAIALHAGLRRGELCGLQWGDVDLSSRTIHVRRSRLRVRGKLIVSSTKSATSVRDVPISPVLLPILRAAFCLAPLAWVVDCTPETLSRRWKRVQKAADLSQSYRLHDLRHTYATRLILSGCNLRVVSYLLGHSSMEITARIYSHCTAEDAAIEAQRVYASLH